nr:helix-turn-helix domain-containing protein [Saccharopolyspora antimicrobica]
MLDESRSGCPINVSVEVLGDRWSLIVLRDIMFTNRRHFRTLLRESEESIASNILANRLRDLLAAGLLTRDDPGRGHRVTYSLTEDAIELVPVMAELAWWGVRHRPTFAPMRAKAILLHDGGPQMWQAFMEELREQHLGIPLPTPRTIRVSEQLDAAGAAVLAAIS